MWKVLFYKWFGLTDPPCAVCEVLRSQLDESTIERKELLARLLEQKSEPPPVAQQEEFKPIKPQFIPWRVRQQMLEAEDRKKHQLMKDKQEEMQEISNLEKELGVENG